MKESTARKYAAIAAQLTSDPRLQETAVGRTFRWLVVLAVDILVGYLDRRENRARHRKIRQEFKDELQRQGVGETGKEIAGVRTTPPEQSAEPAPPPDEDASERPGILARIKRAIIPTAQAFAKNGAAGAAVAAAINLVGATAAAPPLDMALVTEHYHDVPAEMTRAVIHVESSGRPHAVSESNARGLMQMKRLAMIDAGCGHLQERVHDPIVNVWCGTKYLAQQKERFGTWRRALAAYNRGPTYFAREGFDAMAFEYIRRVQAAGGVL